jgi:hypothetical protein
MDIATDNLLARVLLTLTTLGYSLGPAIADFNATHATNPAWTPHARFHVVWQVASYILLALVGLGLIWIAGPSATARLYLAALLAAAVYAGFFATAFAMRAFGGRLIDTNGYPPFTTVEVAGRAVPLDRNTTVFSVMVALLILGVLAIR